MSEVANLTTLDKVRMRIGDLQEALETQNPGMLNYLKDIHTQLLKNPELVHMLQDEERRAIIKGLEVKTGEVITTPKGKTATPKAPKGGSVADFL